MDLDDDFDGLLDDGPLDEELEQSLAHIEASFTQQSQQQLRQNPPFSHHVSSQGDEQPSNLAAKETLKQANGQLPAQKSRPGVDDFRVSHPRQQGRRGLPTGDDFEDEDDTEWDGMDLDRAENEAITLSQQKQPATFQKGVKRPRLSSEGGKGPASVNLMKQERPTREVANQSDDRTLIAELQRKLAAAEQDFAKLKREKQAKEGEASLLRTHLSKVTSEFSMQSRDFERAKAEHKAILAQVDKDRKEQLSRTQTLYAFKQMEQATSIAANSWANITASVQRRRARMSDHRNTQGPASQSQSYAAAFGLSTPTRRGRNQARNLGSGGSHGSGGGAQRTGMSKTQEDSPSGRLEKRARATPAQPPKKAAAAFPGLVNTFASSASAKKKQGKIGAAPSTPVPPQDDQVFEDDGRDLLAEEMEVDRSRQRSGPGHSPAQQQSHPAGLQPDDVSTKAPRQATGWDSWQQRYLWAVSTYSRRQGFLASLVLTHSSKPCSSIDRRDADDEAKSYVSRDPKDDSRDTKAFSTSTLHRIMDPDLAPGTPRLVQEQYAMLTDLLLQALSQGAAIDAEDRFAYLLNALDSDRDDLSEDERNQLQEQDFWIAFNEIEEGIDVVLLQLSCCLKALAGIAMKLGMVERIYDILRLTATICSHHPTMERRLQTRHPIVLPLSSHAVEAIAVADTQSLTTSQAQLSSLLKLEYALEDIVVESIRKLCLVDGKVAKAVGAGEAESASGHVKATPKQSRPTFEWKYSAEGREDVIAALVTLLELFAWDSMENQRAHVRKIIEAPGILFALLSSQRRASTMHRTLCILIHLCQYESMWRPIVGCQPDDALQPNLPNRLKRSKTPFLHLLAQHLVDRRTDMETEQAHEIHADIVALLSQLVIAHPQDALLVLSDSDPILAALVKCLQLDAGLVWGGSGDPNTSETIGDVVERICMDTRLLAQLYLVDVDDEDETRVVARPADLAKKITGHECQALLNGVQHCFVVGMGRVAYAEEPGWVGEAERKALGEVGPLASELLNLVLAPDENDALWEALEDEDEDDSDEEVHDEEMESLTEGEEEDDEVVVAATR